jgi:hypothetical protein
MTPIGQMHSRAMDKIMAIFLRINDHEVPYMPNYRPKYAKIRKKWPISPKRGELF